MSRRIGEYISLELFYFVNLTSSCSFIPLKGRIRPELEALDLQGSIGLRRESLSEKADLAVEDITAQEEHEENENKF